MLCRSIPRPGDQVMNSFKRTYFGFGCFDVDTGIVRYGYHGAEGRYMVMTTTATASQSPGFSETQKQRELFWESHELRKIFIEKNIELAQQLAQLGSSCPVVLATKKKCFFPLKFIPSFFLKYTFFQYIFLPFFVFIVFVLFFNSIWIYQSAQHSVYSRLCVCVHFLHCR